MRQIAVENYEIKFGPKLAKSDFQKPRLERFYVSKYYIF